MGDQRNGGIAWTEETWNPLRGCSRVSEGCRNCYAETVAGRFSGPGQPYEGLVRLAAVGKYGRMRWNGTVRFVAEKLGEPLRWRRPRMVFVNSMSDLFHESVTFEQIAAIFGVMAASPNHTFQVLTKRPARMREWFASNVGLESMKETVAREGAHLAGIVWDARGSNGWKYPDGADRPNRRAWPGWPLPNVWLGVSVEDQASADARIPHLLDTPAAVRWVSYEPALEAVDFTSLDVLRQGPPEAMHPYDPIVRVNALTGHVRGPDEYHPTRLDWIVVGGESGPGARPFDLAWARSVIAQTRETDCRVFVKQLGAEPTLGGDGGPVTFRKIEDRKGGDPSEWPEDLRVREWPEVSR